MPVTKFDRFVKFVAQTNGALFGGVRLEFVQYKMARSTLARTKVERAHHPFLYEKLSAGESRCRCLRRLLIRVRRFPSFGCAADLHRAGTSENRRVVRTFLNKSKLRRCDTFTLAPLHQSPNRILIPATGGALGFTGLGSRSKLLEQVKRSELL